MCDGGGPLDLRVRLCPKTCGVERIRPATRVWRSGSSQMPRHLISDAHEWINEIPTVPIYYLAKPQPRERAWQN